MENLADYWYGDGKEYAPFTDDEHLATICAKMAQRILDDDPQGVEWILEHNERDFIRYSDDPTYRKLAISALEYGAACGNGACANFLGALHVQGDVVDQDRRRAVELFKIGERWGVAQSAVNLGYSYEYGWLGEPDYTKAFMQYAKTASLGEHPEALYKLGDMYARAKVVEQDLRVAYLLYEKSYNKAGDNLVIKAQSAFRMAQLMEDPDNQEWDIPYDPMQAFAL